jgi:hypothetical protein
MPKMIFVNLPVQDLATAARPRTPLRGSSACAVRERPWSLPRR